MTPGAWPANHGVAMDAHAQLITLRSLQCMRNQLTACERTAQPQPHWRRTSSGQRRSRGQTPIRSTRPAMSEANELDPD
eukprot:6678850-Alexandrium_andersonii.AAC.1